jgi:hypothetical protein
MGLAEDLAREYGVDFEEAPNYSEIIERFGEEVSSDRAVEVTNTLQRQYSNLVAFGGVIGSEYIWGARPSRDTTRDLDFVSDPRTAAEFAGDCSESWLYEGIVVSVVEYDGEDWMIGNLPCATECFHSEHMKPFSVDPVEVLEPEIVDTPYGDIATVSAAACASSKFRRYIQNRLERGSYKEGDLVDVCNIFMADSEADCETDIDRTEFKRRCQEIRGQGIETDEVYDDMLNSIQGSSAEIYEGEFEDLWSKTLEPALNGALD